MPTEKEQTELTKEYEKAHDKVLYLVEKHKGINEQFVAFLLYLSSENLVRHSKHLTWLTIVLTIFALGMIGLAIAQLVVISS